MGSKITRDGGGRTWDVKKKSVCVRIGGVRKKASNLNLKESIYIAKESTDRQARICALANLISKGYKTIEEAEEALKPKTHDVWNDYALSCAQYAL